MIDAYVENYSLCRPIVFHRVGMCVPILNEECRNGRGVEVFVECDARQQVAAVAESVSAVAAGDLFGPEGGHGAGTRLLEFVLEREEAVLPVSAMDT
jgi:hypothetical protein